MNNLKTSEDCSEVISRNKTSKKVSRLAIASLTFGILGFGSFTLSFAYAFFRIVDVSIVPSFIALVLGISAIIVIVSHRKRLRGIGYAIVSIVLVIPCVSFVTVANISIRMRAYHEKANTGRYNLRLLGKVMAEYSKDHDGYLPVANQWCDLLMEYDNRLSRENFKHPKVKYGACNFAYNKNLDGLRLVDVPGDVVLLFEADGDWNLTGTADLLETRRTKYWYSNVLLVNQTIYRFYEDGVRNKTSYEHKPLRWKP